MQYLAQMKHNRSGWRGPTGRGDEQSPNPGRDYEQGIAAEAELCDGRGAIDTSKDGGNGPKAVKNWEDQGGWRRALREDEVQEILENAPWAMLVQNQKVWNVAVKNQIESLYEPSGEEMIQSGYWMRDEEMWKFHPGLMPSTAPEEGVVVALGEMSQSFLELEEGHGVLKKGLRKRLLRNVEDAVVSEVYSEPRVSRRAPQVWTSRRKQLRLEEWLRLQSSKRPIEVLESTSR